MRVLHVISSLDRNSGGPTTALLGLALAQAKCGLRVSVLSAFQSGPETGVVESLQRQGISVLHAYGDITYLVIFVALMIFLSIRPNGLMGKPWG